MNERLKELRAQIGMNQQNFAKALGIGQSTLAMMEVGKREISERHVKTICAIFNVSEDWLKYGVGKMFVNDTEEILRQLSVEYNLSDDERDMIQKFLSLNPEQRKIISNYTHFISTQVENNQENNLK